MLIGLSHLRQALPTTQKPHSLTTECTETTENLFSMVQIFLGFYDRVSGVRYQRLITKRVLQQWLV
jgi:hypothetical protein